MDEAKRTTIRRWLARAEHDLLTARDTFSAHPQVTDTVCFHAQQCAEKMLKAMLVYVDFHVQKTHDLQALLATCVGHDPSFRELVEAADMLNSYSVQVRYVENWRDIPAEEAAEAIRHAERVTQFVSGKLAGHLHV